MLQPGTTHSLCQHRAAPAAGCRQGQPHCHCKKCQHVKCEPVLGFDSSPGNRQGYPQCHSTRCRLFVCHCAPVLGSPSIHRVADWHPHSDTAWGVGCVRVHSPKVTHSQRDQGRDQGSEEGSEGREGGGEREGKETKRRRRKRKTKSEGKR